eukprot:5128158-Prorocentrum_lima.AAC.1
MANSRHNSAFRTRFISMSAHIVNNLVISNLLSAQCVASKCSYQGNWERPDTGRQGFFSV